MKLLLDSHAFLWAIQSPEELSDAAREALSDTSNELLLSLVTIWELQIKSDLGKLVLAKPLRELVDEEIESGRMTLLPNTPEHLYALSGLPLHHRDPFDSLLIAQAQVEAMPLVTKDENIPAYGVAILW